MATIMELMRELKNLAELKKTTPLSSEQEARMREIKAVLDAQMANRPAAGGAPAAPAPRGVATAAPAVEFDATPAAGNIRPSAVPRGNSSRPSSVPPVATQAVKPVSA